MLSEAKSARVSSGFTGDSCRLAFEVGYDALAEYKKSFANMGKPEWQKWYEKFKPHVNSSHWEIMKQLS
jgi:hypothetical protein